MQGSKGVFFDGRGMGGPRIYLDGMSPESREVILLARIHGLPLKDISDRMNRSPAAVAQLLSRALRKLRVFHFEVTLPSASSPLVQRAP